MPMQLRVNNCAHKLACYVSFSGVIAFRQSFVFPNFPHFIRLHATRDWRVECCHVHAAECIPREKGNGQRESGIGVVSIRKPSGYFLGWLSGSRNGHIMKQMLYNRSLCEARVHYVTLLWANNRTFVNKWGNIVNIYQNLRGDFKVLHCDTITPFKEPMFVFQSFLGTLMHIIKALSWFLLTWLEFF